MPKRPSRVLDLGAGIGRDAAILAKWGHTVSAVEPTEELSIAGMQMYGSSDIEWIADSLPPLEQLKNRCDIKVHRYLKSAKLARPVVR